MFGLLKAAVGVVLLPVDAAVDVGRAVVNMGDIDRRKSQVEKRMRQISDNVDEALD